ncbi:MAG: SWIM zinc finger family protein [Ilumatobacter sp.]|uniref:SWIM zinc finger family protein n=1 Tax=Ilumatobacter sp. TaxID=1967498 RepID=UPI0039189A82
MGRRWSTEQVESVAASRAALSSATPLAAPGRWVGLGADERAVWGSFHGSGAEPYDTMVDHVTVGFRCSCPSRRSPCKHALALLLLWARDQVIEAMAPQRVEAWVTRRSGAGRSTSPVDEHGAPPAPESPTNESDTGDRSNADRGSTPTDDGATDEATDSATDEATDEAVAPPSGDERDRARDERVERMFTGLAELDRWLDDRMRTGLADPALARYATWDDLAARLVDAQAASLANRVRRLAGLVGASPTWHDDVLAEIGILHLLAQAGRRLGSLPGSLADAVATSVGWQVRQADVLGGVPDTDDWVVAGRSDVREDRIEVRRFWLRGVESGRWALLLSFAAYQQSLDTSLEVGTAVRADLHRYPGGALRSLLGRREGDAIAASPPAVSIVDACDEVGRLLVAEPWLERLPMVLHAAPARVGDHWVLTDGDVSVPIRSSIVSRREVAPSLATLLAVSAGRPLDLTVEWSPHGVTPLTIHLPDRSVDIGPRADPSFVGAA